MKRSSSGRRSAGNAAIQRLAKSIPGVRVVWSPANHGWMVLWGKTKSATADLSVLKVTSKKADLMDYLKSLKGS